METQDIAIYGAGGYGREVACLIRQINEASPEPIWNFIGYFDDGVPAGTPVAYGEVLGGLDVLNAFPRPLGVVIAIGSPEALGSIPQKIVNPRVSFPNLIAPDVVFLDRASVVFGRGNVIGRKSVISCNAVLGNFNIAVGSLTVGHDARIGNANAFFPGATVSGTCSIGDGNFFGMHSMILESVKVGSRTRIGAGAFIVRDTEDGFLYFGSPARKFDFAVQKKPAHPQKSAASPKLKILVTGACAVSARSVVRSLRESEKFSDCEIIGWDMATLLYGVYEGLYDRLYKVPAVASPDYRRVAEEILQRERPDAAIVVPEVEVLAWAENPFPVKHIVPPAEFCRVAISKKRLFDALAGTGLIPRSVVVPREAILSGGYESPLGYPVWIRDCAAGTASGKGSLKAMNSGEMRAWVEINAGVSEFQLSEFLPGGNFGCFCLFKNGALKKTAIAERIEYIMAKVAVSGITGNTAKGRLLNDAKIRETALEAVRILTEKTGTVMNGLIVVDLKADAAGTPKITEINLRHVAYSSLFASAGFNLAEYHLLCALDREDELSPETEMAFPPENLILRDVDGVPLYVPHPQPLRVGECFPPHKKN